MNQASSNKRIRNLHILVVEDDQSNRVVASALLERSGHTVVVVENGAEALEFLDVASFDLILMDLVMPILDGLETTKRIRRREEGTGRHTPIIGVSSDAVKGQEKQLLEQGMDGFILKPLTRESLLSAVYRAISDVRGPR